MVDFSDEEAENDLSFGPELRNVLGRENSPETAEEADVENQLRKVLSAQAKLCDERVKFHIFAEGTEGVLLPRNTANYVRSLGGSVEEATKVTGLH